MKLHMTLIYRLHALNRMSQRGFTPADISDVLANGRPIEEYPDDRPYPSCLVLGWLGQRPVHVVVAVNDVAAETIVITVYEPDPAGWSDRFTRRKQ